MKKIFCTSLILALLAMDAIAADVAPWHKPGWRFRKTVVAAVQPQDKDLPAGFNTNEILFGKREVIGRAEITVEWNDQWSGRDIVVVDTRGNEVPCRVFPSGWGKDLSILFNAGKSGGLYYVYYGNPDPGKTEVPQIAQPGKPVQMVSVRGEAATLGDAIRMLSEAKDVKGRADGNAVNHLENPLKLDKADNCITAYSGLINTTNNGSYEFSLDTGGRAWLFINGQLMLTAVGRNRPSGFWKERTPVTLPAGTHTFTIIQIEKANSQGVRFGWRQPGERQIIPLEGTALSAANYIAAKVIALEEKDKPITPFFVADAGVAFDTPDGKSIAAVKFNNLTTGEGYESIWHIEGKTLKEHSPQIIFPAGAAYDVVLQITKDGREVGTYSQKIDLRNLFKSKAKATAKLLLCPNFVYASEKPKATLLFESDCPYPMPVQMEMVDVRANAVVPAQGDVTFDVPLPALGDAEQLDILFQFNVAGMKIAEQKVRLARPAALLRKITAKNGYLVDEDGTRLIVMAEIEKETTHRKWAALKWAKSFAEETPKSVLLFGERMENEHGGSSDYVTKLEALLTAEKIKFSCVERSTELPAPSITDIPAFVAALEKEKPELLIISPGMADIRAGTSAADFGRALDICIEIARTQANPPAIVIAVPPPVLGQAELSEEHARAARAVAQSHRLKIADFAKIIADEKEPGEAYRPPQDKNLNLAYPKDSIQKQFAETLLDIVK